VARDENFLAFADKVAKAALASKMSDTENLLNLSLTGTNQTIDEARQSLIAKVGENINIRRIVMEDANTSIGAYLHGNRIGVLVELDVENKELAKDIAMHIAASKPMVINPQEVPAEIIAKEKEIYKAQSLGSGKPEDIIEKMVAGKLKKYLDEISLVGQPFIKDPNTLVGTLLNKHRAKVVSFTRFEVGEGIEKEAENFVEAVMAQVHGSE